MTFYEITLRTSGYGIVFYSPALAQHIGFGENYLEEHYESPEDVRDHIVKGTIVGFCTGSGGCYILRIHQGKPDNERITGSEHKHRLGVHSPDGIIYFRDLFDLLVWDPWCPDTQCVLVAPGYYRVTLLTNTPSSGIVGEDQIIEVYLEMWDQMPELRINGVPQLC
jgi:hypothetical protein